MRHELKTWPDPFFAMKSGKKTFEIRAEDDKRFEEGDELVLKEWNPNLQFLDKYTGDMLHRRVDYVLRNQDFGIAPGYCIMSVSKI